MILTACGERAKGPQCSDEESGDRGRSPEDILADVCVFAVLAPLPDFPQELAESLQLAADPHLHHGLGPAA